MRTTPSSCVRSEITWRWRGGVGNTNDRYIGVGLLRPHAYEADGWVDPESLMTAHIPRSWS